jgi:hypothetical protein
MSNTLDRSQLKFDRMPDIAGDPIVESGSNVDGEWTRWGDGTQICSGLVSTGAPALRQYAVSFIATPRNPGGSNINSNSVVDDWGTFNTSDGTGFTHRWRTRTDVQGSYTAIGRWK